VETNISTYVGNCARLAALLEVSAYPKPGNVHRLSDFPETSYEHFLAGGVALGSVMGKLAERASETRAWGEVRIGEGIRKAVDETYQWQNGGNTHLGIILLFAPLSAGAGAALSYGNLDVKNLREFTKKIISWATPNDTIDIYAAIDQAMSSENLGSSAELNVKDQDSIRRIIRENITPIDVFELCKDRDMICHEWVTGFGKVFEIGYPTLKKRIMEGSSINNATIDAFLKILSENPDSLIMRKMGEKAAKLVSEQAKIILEVGGSESDEGIRMLWNLDEELKKEKGRLNPGTTADLTAASLYILVLSGWRP
jgi:triphosphoribosyl-dephospho-CoA synthase